MKLLLSTLTLATIGLTGCVVAPYDEPYAYGNASTVHVSTNVGSNAVLQYSYGNGYYYDNTYDYYDGAYGAYVGNVWYVYRNDGSRYAAPNPRFKNPRFTDQKWPGYNGNYNWMYRRPTSSTPSYQINNNRNNNNYWRGNDVDVRPNVRPQPSQPTRPNINNYPNQGNQGMRPNNSQGPNRPDGVFKPDNKPNIQPNRPGGQWGGERNNRDNRDGRDNRDNRDRDGRDNKRD